MLTQGDIAVAVVQRQVMVVQGRSPRCGLVLLSTKSRITRAGARTHTLRDRWLDVHIFSPFGDRLFLASAVTSARILSTDILTIFPPNDAIHLPSEGTLELHPKAFSEFLELRARMQKKYEQLLRDWFRT